MKWCRSINAIKNVCDIGGIVDKSVVICVPMHILRATNYTLVSSWTCKDGNNMFFEMEKKPPSPPEKPPVDLEKPPGRHFHYLA